MAGKPMSTSDFVSAGQATAFLAHHLKTDEPVAVTLIGEGAWSRCFGFRHDGADLAVRFGKHLEDFRKDALAAAYATPDLPVPAVLAVGPAFDGYYAISQRAYGVPLENVSPDEWLHIVPSVVAVLEAMRTADISATTGFGGWDAEGRGSHATWSSHLLAVAEHSPEHRTYGWRDRLAKVPEGEEAFAWGLALLETVVSDDIPRCLTHCDLINRNVLVDGGRITAVFDWGCSRYGDHLYDLAWFEFWAPWLPDLDVQALRRALQQRWDAVGYVPVDFERRLMTCHLHIGLDHLGYNAFIGDRATLLATAERMRTLVAEGERAWM